MTEELEMGAAGSLTMAILFLVVAVLMRSFYKRYTRMKKREEDEPK